MASGRGRDRQSWDLTFSPSRPCDLDSPNTFAGRRTCPSHDTMAPVVTPRPAARHKKCVIPTNWPTWRPCWAGTHKRHALLPLH